MTVTLTSRVQAALAGTFSDARDLGTTTYPETLSYLRPLADGVAINCANLMFDDIRSLTSAQVENLDLAGVLTDALGRTVTAAKITAMMFTAPATNTVDITIGNHATAAFLGPFGAAGHTLKLSPGGVILIANPTLAAWTVTATTADMIMVTNGAATSSYSVCILGRTA